MTSWPSLQTDVRNADAEQESSVVVTDQGLETSRKPDDIPAFGHKLIEEIAEGGRLSRETAPSGASVL